MVRREARFFRFRICLAACTLAALGFVGMPGAAAQEPAAAPTIESAAATLKMRAIGPAVMGGRIDDIAALASDPETVYIGAATGGVWKTTDGGATWTPLFDAEPNLSIGAIAIAPSNPSIVWVGSGEANNRQSSSWGDGVYKSTDAGKTWAHLGLDDTQAIGRIVIDPTNPDIVYVAALGHLWGASAERGLFKTTDGGRTWQKALFIDNDTGVSDVAIDPISPNILYAAAYERRRTPWGFDGGGAGSGIYKTTDGGATWTKLTAGLPDNGNTGRIGLAVYLRNPNIVYALVQNAQGGVFRSEDKGATWTRMSATDPRPLYFSQIRIDPSNDLRLWIGGSSLAHSDDGGKTFTPNPNQQGLQAIHPDFHAIWIDPNDSGYMLVGCDGGVYLSRDAGKDWNHLDVMPLGQAYEVGYDNQQPYHVCAGYQDDAEWCGPSRTLESDELFGATGAGGILNSDWVITGDGDGFYTKPDPEDPQTIYTESEGGNLFRRDLRTGEARVIRPVQPDAAGAPYRFNWNTPLVISAFDHKTLYFGGNFLFESTDRGDNWTRLGGDLTTGVDRNTLPMLGKLPSRDTLSLYDGVSQYPTITTIAESPISRDVLWVGTDDGNLQVSRDHGKTWTNVAERVPGLPKGTYVVRVVPSKYAEGTAFVAFDGHRADDFHVYLFKTTDYGQSWTSISSGLPESGGTLHVIREHPTDRNLLFAGAEFGAYFSLDGGQHWNKLRGGLPSVPVDDIQIQPRENDLILATHGRSLYILDDLTPIEQLSSSILAEVLHLFPIRPAIEWRLYQNSWFPGQEIFVGPNPPYGALIDFYLKEKLAKGQSVRISVQDAAGKTVREMDVENGEPGINRVNWDLRYDSPVKPTPEKIVMASVTNPRTQAQGPAASGPRGPMVEPGTYTVKVALLTNSQTQSVRVEEDPRIRIAPAERAARQAALMQLYDMFKTADQGRRTVVGLRRSLNDALASWKQADAPNVPGGVRSQAEALSKSLGEIAGRFVSAGGFGGGLHYTPPSLTTRVGQLMSQLEAYTAAPSASEQQRIAQVSQQLTEATRTLDSLVRTDLARLNKSLDTAGVPRILATPSATPEPAPGGPDQL